MRVYEVFRQGKGLIVEGTGLYEEGDDVEISISSTKEYEFEKAVINGETITDSSYKFVAGVRDVVINLYAKTTNFSILKHLVGFYVPDEVIERIAKKRSIDTGGLEPNSRSLALAKADMLMYGATLPNHTGSVKDADGGWSHSTASVTINTADKELYKKMANNIYKEFNEPESVIAGTKVRLVNLFGKPYRR